jgi:Fe-Mn family superoxide dismutase
MNRRDALLTLSAAAALAAAPRFAGAALAEETKAEAFTLPPLGYAYEALEPHIDTATMKVHHTGHHAAFIKALNELAPKVEVLATKPIAEVLGNLAGVPDEYRTKVRNNLGGHFNHSLYWDLMTPGGAKEPAGDLKSAIDGAFGSTEKLMEEVNKAGLGRFGSGWAWLVVDKDKKLAVINTPYQDTPHMDAGAKPVIGVDVWEHAYYLKHQNKRADYLKAWWNVVNWDKAAANFKAASG